MSNATRYSSPISLPLHPHHAAHVRHEVQNLVVPHHEQELTVGKFWEILDHNVEEFAQYHLGDHGCPKAKFSTYMNEISKAIHKSFDHSQLIYFHDTSKVALLDHPTGTLCKPDISACPTTAGKIHWTEVDATAEIHSAGVSMADGARQAISYTLYLLQARPDRVSVQGFFADAKGVTLIISSAVGVKKSPRLDLKDAKQSLLVYAFINRLYNPLPSMIDPTVKRRKDLTRAENSLPGLWVFDIILTIPNSPSLECVGYRIEVAGLSVGRRAHVFANNDSPTKLGDIPITVIKDQYCFLDHRFHEAEVLHSVHAGGHIPGVIQLVHSEDVIRSDGSHVSVGNRQKKRIALVEYGKSFMDLKTPLDALKVIYDLLETTRLLYKKRGILHRDISSGNVLYMEKDSTILLPTDADIMDETSDQDTYFIRHLLNPKVAPNVTINLLVDFDRGEICNTKQDQRRLERTGTPIFMPRAIRAGHPLGKAGRLAYYTRMPELSHMAHVYTKVFPDRLRDFQHSPDSPNTAIMGTLPDSFSLNHELRHDAESIFWLLLWWIVGATPADGIATKIPHVTWSLFVGTTIDSRPLNIHGLDPGYAPLSALLADLADAIEYDLHWANHLPYTHPEFLHEVFQRLILNFILENRNKEFMNLVKDCAARRPERAPTSASLGHDEVAAKRLLGGNIKQTSTSSFSSENFSL